MARTEARQRRLRRTASLLAVLLATFLTLALLPPGNRFDIAVGSEAEARIAALPLDPQAHRLRLIDHYRDAWMSRIALIRDARRSIEISSFIWRDDASGRALFAELLAAAERGVQVRVLGDAVFFLRDPPQLRRMAGAHPRLQLRLYNPVDDRATALGLGSLDDLLGDFKLVNRRMHIKLLIVDGEQVLLGGRNVGDEYFGRHAELNFVDRDLVLQGPAVAEAVRCFDRYWRHRLSVDARRLDDVAAVDPDGLAPLRGQQAPLDRAALGADWRTVRRVGIWYDEPDSNGLGRHYDPGVLADRLAALMGCAREALRMDSPYLVLSDRTRQLFARMREEREQLPIVCLTNSLAATDNWQAYAAMFAQMRELLGDIGMRIHAHRPQALRELAGGSSGRTCTHGKTFLVDERFAAIGSFNLDPRSGYWNAELMLVVEDRELVAELIDRFELRRRPEHAWVIAENRRPPVIDQAEELLAAINRIAAQLLQFNPWPLTNHSYYALERGDPVPPDDPRFHQRYRALGPFPEVELGTNRRIMIQLFSSLGETASPTL